MANPSLHHSIVDVAGLPIHVVEGGAADSSRSFLFVHGWPQCATAFEPIMLRLADAARVVALDLPGVGRSTQAAASGDKRTLATCVRGVARQLELRGIALVGHDIGGQVAYAYLRRYAGELERVVLMNIAIPGVEPWPRVSKNPRIWHFAFHAVPGLPETLVGGKQAAYFDYFFDTIAATPDAVGVPARRRYAAAYARPDALRAGFDWYRAFPQDERDNLESHGMPCDTPVLCLRGDKDSGANLDAYVRGLRDAGMHEAEGALIHDSGHFAPDEQPGAVAATLRRFHGIA